MSTEPEIVKRLSDALRAAKSRQGNGEQSDSEKLLSIYGHFRWSLKKATMIGQVTYHDLDALLDAGIKRIEKQLKESPLRDKALEQFRIAKEKLLSFKDDQEQRADVCPKCQIPRFICLCNSSEEKAQ